MADELRAFFDRRVITSIGDEVAAADGRFDRDAFVARALRGLGPLSLTERGAHIGEALFETLDRPFPDVVPVLITSLRAPHASSESFGMEPFRYLPHVSLVARHGLEHFEPSMVALVELTKRFTSEFAIRPFLERYPEATYARLVAWASDPDVHVRRLVSEGTRPRLPWASRLPAFVRDPSPVIALLDRLVDDPERYVQRSVANNLNDIAKDHPALAVEVAQRWSQGEGAGRAYVVRHGLRSLVKQGHPGALALLGAGAAPEVEVTRLGRGAMRATLGETFSFEVAVRSTGAEAQSLIVDFAVHFVKANGTTRPKVFKLRRVELPPGGAVELTGRVRFEPMTTRVVYAGAHPLELRVNGVGYPLGTIDVREPGARRRR